MHDTTNKKTCFVIMPFTLKEHDQPKYNDPNHWNEVYEGLIFPAVALAKMKCERDDKDIGSRLIAENILRKIEEADLILCDLSSYNPNVFLELGWALRGDKSYVLIKDGLTNYTFDLNQQYIFDYSHLLKPSILRSEIEQLAKVIQQTVDDQERRYSLTRRLSYSISAIKAAQEGDPNTRLLLDIQQSIRDLKRGERNIDIDFDNFPWQGLLSRGNAILFKIKKIVENLSEISTRDEIVAKLDETADELGVRHHQNFQITLVDEGRIIVYHDQNTQRGSYAEGRGIEGADFYDEVYLHPHGAIAWIDKSSNVPKMGKLVQRRHNIALFTTVEKKNWKVVVEIHQEIIA